MKQDKINNMIILTPEDDHTLTQASDLIELKDRIFSKKLYLGKYDKPENYKEITDTEAEILRKELEDLLKAEFESENPQNIED